MINYPWNLMAHLTLTARIEKEWDSIYAYFANVRLLFNLLSINTYKQMIAVKQQESIRTIIEEIVDRQLERNQPPETGRTYDRLVSQSYTDEEARMLISRTIQVELYRLMRFGEPFNQVRFVSNLNQLPDLPDTE